MDNTINNDIIEKVTIKSVAIYKAIGMLPPIETKDLWEEKNSIEHQKNYENKNVSEINDTMKDTKMPSMPNDWRDIIDPKLRRKLKQKHRYEVNKDKIKSINKIWRENNRDSLLLKKKAYYQANKDKIKSRYKPKLSIEERERKKLIRKISNRLRQRLCKAISSNFKSGSAVNDVGCTITELKVYLESKFQPGMTWDNWSFKGWHIDHIKPLSSFDLTDRKQMLEACHYTNLQPLWAKDNLTKNNKVIPQSHSDLLL